VLDFETRAVEQAKRLLQEVADESVEVLSLAAGVGGGALLQAGECCFLVQSKRTSSASTVHMAAKHLHQWAAAYGEDSPASARLVPLLAVPYMGEVGRRICAEEHLSWVDLSGNADIRAPGLRVFITGHENRFKRRGRRATPFAPQASRLARQLVVGEQREYTQKELVDLTGLDQGFLSRVLRSLVEKGLVERRGKVYEVTSRSLLLESWQEVYDFTKHQIIKGHIPARTSEDLLSTLSASLDHDGVVSAATGLAGAWLLTHFASFRLATFYVSHHPSQDHLATLGFREEEKGANTWLVIPNDEAVFTGRDEREGVSCAHPVQVYLDLRFHPERSREAAERVRALYLNGEDDA
jgi:hypothetical protein